MARAARMAAQKRSNSPRRRARADFFCRHRRSAWRYVRLRRPVLVCPYGDRFYCILIGVSIGTMFMLILSSHRAGDISKRLLEKLRRTEAVAG